jgi:hypothetical protein
MVACVSLIRKQSICLNSTPVKKSLEIKKEVITKLKLEQRELKKNQG